MLTKEEYEKKQDIENDIKEKDKKIREIDERIATYSIIKHINDRVESIVKFANSLSESIGKVYDHLIGLTDKMIKYSNHMKELELRIIDLEKQVEQLKKEKESNI